MSFIYLASPYSHFDFNIRQQRHSQVAEAVVEISRHAVPIYSPIVHWHAIAVEKDLPTSADAWKLQNEALIVSSVELWVLCIDGWRQSKGVEMEINFAREKDKTVRYLTFASLGETCAIYKAKLHKARVDAVIAGS